MSLLPGRELVPPTSPSSNIASELKIEPLLQMVSTYAAAGAESLPRPMSESPPGAAANTPSSDDSLTEDVLTRADLTED